MLKLKIVLMASVVGLACSVSAGSPKKIEGVIPAAINISYNKNASPEIPTKSGIDDCAAKFNQKMPLSSKNAEKALRVLFVNHRSGEVVCSLPGKNEKFVVTVTFPARSHELTRSVVTSQLPTIVVKGPWDKMPQEVRSFVAGVALGNTSSMVGAKFFGGSVAVIGLAALGTKFVMSRPDNAPENQGPTHQTSTDSVAHKDSSGDVDSLRVREESTEESDEDSSSQEGDGKPQEVLDSETDQPATPDRRGGDSASFELVVSPFKPVNVSSVDEQDVVMKFCKALNDERSENPRFEVFDVALLGDQTINETMIDLIPNNTVLVFRGDQIQTALLFADNKDKLCAKNIKLVVLNCDQEMSSHEGIDGILWCKNEPVSETWNDINQNNQDFLRYWNTQLGLELTTEA